MKIYIDSDFKCHISNADGRYREVESEFFDGKCDAFVESYRFVPAGEAWTRSDGAVFSGEMITLWKPYDEPDDTQKLLAEYTEYLKILGVEV